MLQYSITLQILSGRAGQAGALHELSENGDPRIGHPAPDGYLRAAARALHRRRPPAAPVLPLSSLPALYAEQRRLILRGLYLQHVPLIAAAEQTVALIRLADEAALRLLQLEHIRDMELLREPMA